jgi:hypothetical protein
VILLIANGIPEIKGTTVAKQSKVSGCLVTNEKILALVCGGCLEVVSWVLLEMDGSIAPTDGQLLQRMAREHL